VATPRTSVRARSKASEPGEVELVTVVGPGLLEVGLARGEHPVGDVDLTGVDQGLAVEPELACLPALDLEPLSVAHVVVDAVENDLARRPRAEQAEREPREQGSPAGHHDRAELLVEVVRPHDEDGEPVGGRGDSLGMEDGARCLEHRPEPGVPGRSSRLHRTDELSHLLR